jgi:membrane fusion protein, multidrug efflux system
VKYLQSLILAFLLTLSHQVLTFSEESFTTRALVTAKDQAVLSSEISARIKSIPLSLGDKFIKGQNLIEFDCSLFLAQHRVVEANLSSAEITLKSNIQLAEVRSIGLYEVDLAQASLERAGAELLISNINLKRCVIKAPYNGRVANIQVKNYESIQAQQPLIEVIGTGILEAQLMVPSEWLSWIKINQSMSILIDETNESYQATVISIGASVDPVSQTIDLRAKFIKDYENLLPGMSGTVSF